VNTRDDVKITNEKFHERGRENGFDELFSGEMGGSGSRAFLECKVL
jgi:hypothetical protein